MEIKLSNRFKVVGINRRSQVQLLEDLKVGDTIQLEYPISHRTYQRVITVTHLQNGETATFPVGVARNVLNAFELEDVTNEN